MSDEVEQSIEGLFPDGNSRPHRFPSKRPVFVGCRVHPGEVAASFCFNGMLDALLDPDDPRMAELRDEYVFKMVPMICPDGVRRGHYRSDEVGANLNRAYRDPSRRSQAAVYGIKEVVRRLAYASKDQGRNCEWNNTLEYCSGEGIGRLWRCWRITSIS